MGGGGGGNFEMMIPGNLVARVIGKGGEVIKALQEETGAKIVIIQESKEFANEKLLKITGPPDKVEFARMRVDQVIAEEQKKMGGHGGGGRGGRGGGRGGFRGGRGGGGDHYGGGGGGGYDITDTIAVPGNKVGLVMGKGGETISAICRDSGAHCQVDKNAPEGAREKNIVIKGPPEAIERAKQMIYEKVGGGPPPGSNYGGHRGGGGGGGYQGGYGQPDPGFHPPAPAGVPGPGQGGPGQPDYSAQWAEYYRSLGMHKEAELIEQQMAQRAPPAPAPAPVSQPPTQPDYSAQWAEYYRSIGKDKEAEAIEAQMRAKTGGPGPGPGQYGGPGGPQFHHQPGPGQFQPQPQYY